MSSSSAFESGAGASTAVFWLTFVLVAAVALRSASVKPTVFGFSFFGPALPPPAENFWARSWAALSSAMAEEIDTHEKAIRAAAPRAAALRNVLPRAMGSPLGSAQMLQRTRSSLGILHTADERKLTRQLPERPLHQRTNVRQLIVRIVSDDFGNKADD
jgi:hypothetical protein